MIPLKFLFSFHAFLSVIFLMFFKNFQLSDAAPVVSSEIEAMMYLQKHGYMNESSSNAASLMSEKAFSSEIKDFQRFAGLSETGLLDNSTLKMMNMPYSDVARRKRQALQERFVSDLCQDSSLNAATVTEDGKTYVFKGYYYWELHDSGIVNGYPRKITEDWGGLPGNLDAALTVKDGQTFFFKKHQYWRFRNKNMDFGYPRLISDGFKGIPDNIDTAFVWSGNMETYFFKGRYYWKYDSQHEPPVSSHYPQSLSLWKGLPFDIDAAIQWTNQRTYFFKGQEYYRFDDKEVSVEKVDPPHSFPRLTSTWWFGCPSQPSSDKDLSKSSLNELDHPFHVDEDVNATDSTIPTEDVYDDTDMKSSDEMDVNMGRYGIAKTLVPRVGALDSAASSLLSANNVAIYLFFVVIAQWTRMYLLSI